MDDGADRSRADPASGVDVTQILPDAPDNQKQTSGSMVFLQSIAVNLAHNASMFPDITNQIQPNFQALAYLWIPAGLPTDVVAVENVGLGFGLPVTQWITVQPGVLTQLAMVGAAIVNIGAATMQVGITNTNAGATTGTLHVFGVTAPAFVTPITMNAYEGIGGSTGLISVTAGSTTTILAAPNRGTYYRIKTIAYRAGGTAPGANTPITFQFAGGGNEIVVFSSIGQANETQRHPMDWQCNQGIELHNSASQTVNGLIAYELWSN